MAEFIDENVANSVAIRPAPRPQGLVQRWFKKRDPVAGTPGTDDDETWNNDLLGNVRALLAAAGIVHTLGPAGDNDIRDAMLNLAATSTQRGTLTGEFRRISASTAGIRPSISGSWAIDIDLVVLSSAAELVFDHATDFEGAENASQAVYYYVENVAGVLTPHASHTAPDLPGDPKPGYHPVNAGWRCVGALWNNAASDLVPTRIEGRHARFTGAPDAEHRYRDNDAAPGPLDLPASITGAPGPGVWRTCDLNVPEGCTEVEMSFLASGDDVQLMLAPSDATTVPPDDATNPTGRVWDWANDPEAAQNMANIVLGFNGVSGDFAHETRMYVADPSNPQFKAAWARLNATFAINTVEARLLGYDFPYFPDR